MMIICKMTEFSLNLDYDDNLSIFKMTEFSLTMNNDDDSSFFTMTEFRLTPDYEYNLSVFLNDGIQAHPSDWQITGGRSKLTPIGKKIMWQCIKVSCC
jgi:hypothetical protein